MIIKSFTTFAIMTKLIKGINNLFFKLYMFWFFFSQWFFFFFFNLMPVSCPPFFLWGLIFVFPFWHVVTPLLYIFLKFVICDLIFKVYF